MSQPPAVPIIKDSRIPRQLQAVFLASARGESVDKPPADVSVACKVFDERGRAPKNKGVAVTVSDGSLSMKVRAPRLLFVGQNTIEFEQQSPVSTRDAAHSKASAREVVQPIPSDTMELGESRWSSDGLKAFTKSIGWHARWSNAKIPERRRDSL